MNRRIEFWEVIDPQDDLAGGTEGQLTKVFECWGRLDPIKGLVALEFNKVYGEVGQYLTIRYGKYMPSQSSVVKAEGREYMLTTSPEADDRRFLKMHIISK